MRTVNPQHTIGPIARRTFLTTASLGLVAGLSGSRRVSVAQSKTAKAVNSVFALMNRQMAEFKADLYLEAAIHLQALEPENAQEVLYSTASAKETNIRTSFTFVNDHLVTITLCRMLFTAKDSLSENSKPEFRRARYGAPGFLGGTSLEDWPLEPIEIVDGVPFWITNGYTLGGFPEQGTSYLGYCIENCEWNNYRYSSQDSILKQAALEKLLASSKWKRELSKYDQEFLSAQIQ